MTTRRCAGALVAVLLASTAGAEDLFELKKVADGVYAAIARPQPVINCNAAVVVLDDGVLVVDTHSKPSAARALMAQIKTVTDKPVRYVVDTHFHWDHYQGNEAYPSSWPAGLEIIASQPTREAIESRGIPRVKHEILTVPRDLERLRGELARAGADDRKRLQDEIAQREATRGRRRGRRSRRRSGPPTRGRSATTSTRASPATWTRPIAPWRVVD